MFNIQNLNDNELLILTFMCESSEGNGHDFGIISDVTDRYVDGLNKHQVAGYIGALVAKDLLTIYPDEDTCDGVDQFMLKQAVLDWYEGKE